MDIKQVQNEMKANIIQHQNIMGQLKKDSTNSILKAKLKTIQQTIATLGKKQNELLKLKRATLNDSKQEITTIAKNGLVKSENEPLNLKKDLPISTANKPPQQTQGIFVPNSMHMQSAENLRTIYSNASSVSGKSKHLSGQAPSSNNNNGSDNSLLVFPNTNSKNMKGKQLFRILPKKDKQNSSFQTFQAITIVSTSLKTSVVTNHLTSLGVWNKLNENRPNNVQRPAPVSLKNYQKFRIKDGKPVPVGQNIVNTNRTDSPILGKPRNEALKEVLAQAKSIVPEKCQISLSQQVPRKCTGFMPITSFVNGFAAKPPPPAQTATDINQVSAASKANDQPTEKTVYNIGDNITIEHLVRDKHKQIEYLRGLDLVPKEVAKNMLNRRFSKRKTAANPVYSGGIYVAHNDLKRASPDIDVVEKEMAPVRKMRNRQKPKQTEEEAELKSLVENNNELSKLMGTFDKIKSSVSNQLIIDEKQNSPINSVKGGKKYKRKGRKKNSNNVDGHDDQCNVCSEAGEVLMCDTCSLVYHLECCTPPLTQVPTGMWVCSKCRNQFKRTKCETPWSGVTNAVHSYFVHQNRINGEIKRFQSELATEKSLHQKLEKEQKEFREHLQNKLILRSRAQREGKATEEKLQELSTLLKSVFTKTKSMGVQDNIANSSSNNFKEPS